MPVIDLNGQTLAGGQAGGDLVFTASSLDGHFAGAVKAGDERYELWRVRLGRPQGAARDRR